MLETRVPDATTVVLVREGSLGLEVFMAARASGTDFNEGAYVFPGGRVEGTDAELADRCAGLNERDLEHLLAENMTIQQATGCWVAAVRELFEEVGVLLASRSDDAKLDADVWRAELSDGLGFRDLVEREDLTLSTDRLRYFSRYVTPPYAPKRFDTRFVIATAPDDQLPAHDETELVSGEWFTADQAIASYHSRERQIVPPTLQNLVEIAEAGSVDDLLQSCDGRVITPICPTTVRVDGVPTLVYPGDRDYVHTLEPGFSSLDRRPAAMKILRFVLEADGRWDVAPGVPREREQG